MELLPTVVYVLHIKAVNMEYEHCVNAYYDVFNPWNGQDQCFDRYQAPSCSTELRRNLTHGHR